MLARHARDVRRPAQDLDIGMAAYDPVPRAPGVVGLAGIPASRNRAK